MSKWGSRRGRIVLWTGSRRRSRAATALLPRLRAALAAFSEFEKPKKLLVLPGTPQDYPELLTPTLKLKRAALLAAHASTVAALFAHP